MKLYDDVMVVIDKEKYTDVGVKKGMIGRIISAEIRDNSFHVNFIDDRYSDTTYDFEKYGDEDFMDDIYAVIKIDDLQLVNDNHVSDETILDNIPKHNPKWWCKVEDGYIMNLLGEKKNKIQYDYNS